MVREAKIRLYPDGVSNAADTWDIKNNNSFYYQKTIVTRKMKSLTHYTLLHRKKLQLTTLDSRQQRQTIHGPENRPTQKFVWLLSANHRCILLWTDESAQFL